MSHTPPKPGYSVSSTFKIVCQIFSPHSQRYPCIGNFRAVVQSISDFPSQRIVRLRSVRVYGYGSLNSQFPAVSQLKRYNPEKDTARTPAATGPIPPLTEDLSSPLVLIMVSDRLMEPLSPACNPPRFI